MVHAVALSHDYEVSEVRSKTKGWGNDAERVGFTVTAKRIDQFTELQYQIVFDVPLSEGHPLVGDVVEVKVTWQ